jgi:hypothetical protein
MFLLGLVAAFRLPQSVAQSISLTYMKKAEQAQFLKLNDRAVIIYNDGLEPLSFIQYPILRCAVRIALANHTLAPKMPCIAGYYKGALLPLGEYAPSAVPFIAGTYFEPDDTYSAQQVDVMINLSAKHWKKINLLLHREDACELVEAGKLSQMTIPFFFVFKSKNISEGRW